ncbi:MAG: hypothetical protein ACI392_08810 [Paludibacteraceae bacterium]
MANKKKESYFWTSYSDLMTSLFFVMLVLFVLTVALLHKRMVATEEELAQIERINRSIEHIDENYFTYDSLYQRHTLKDVEVSFRAASSNIDDIDMENKDKLLQAGRAIQSFLKRASADSALKDAQYLVIVEGQSSMDSYSRNYELSYERALSLVKFWSRSGVTFDGLPCEMIISGSGYASRFRVKPEIIKDESGKAKGNPQNQRFVIHIIPKPGFK